MVIRHFDEDEPEKVEQTTVEVYSGYLRKTLAKVIGTYPSISFRTEVRRLHVLSPTHD